MSHNTRPLNRQDYKTLTLAAWAARWSFTISSSLFLPLWWGVVLPSGYPGMAASGANLRYFAAGYLARPLGGIVMAHFGDLVGRKKMFTLSILLMAVPTLAIGLLPTYASMGILAPLLLLLMRILQGRPSAVKCRGVGVCRGACSGAPHWYRLRNFNRGANGGDFARFRRRDNCEYQHDATGRTRLGLASAVPAGRGVWPVAMYLRRWLRRHRFSSKCSSAKRWHKVAR